MRVPGWEAHLSAVIARHQSLPGVWGMSDCFIIADDAVTALTGRVMFTKARGYKTEIGAARKLRSHGFANLREAFSSCFTEIPPVLMQRGDIGVIEIDGRFSGGVLTSIGFATRPHGGPVVFVPQSQVTAAFKVE
ncbi:DUF6950 family protein [Rhizobium panacihumi]|uniref:DUF6950 family protein n=1 Tax=Rhizobium panacihumi TaxID=2008450 RepID=UPI003D7B927B